MTAPTPIGTIPRTFVRRRYCDSDPCSVYEIYDAAGAVIYIGNSHDPAQRVRVHRSRAPWREEIDSWSAVWYSCKADAQTAELSRIKAIEPRFNIQGTSIAADICQRRRPAVYQVGLAAYRPAGPTPAVA